VWHNVSGKILSQRFDSSGSKNGSVVLVSTNLNVSTYPDVAMDASGNYVVVWQAATTMANNDIRAQRFASNGARLGNIFVVNTYTTNHQTIPDVAMDANGNFAVTWMSVGQDGSVEGVYAQRFNSTGAYECTDRTYGLSCGVHGGNRELRVNSYTSGSQADQSIAMDSNGDFIIVWDGPGADDTYGIYAQRYDSKGNATGSNFRVNDVIAYAQDNPGVAMRNGIFIVTWSKDECDEYGSCDARATAKVYNGATPLTPEFPLSVGGVANTDQFTTSVAMNESAYAVAWSGVTAISGTNEYPDIIVRASVDRSCIQQPPTCIDNDGDGYGNPGNSGCSNGAQTDCNDANINIHPGATEICNGLDDDCDGSTDEGGVCPTLTYYSDNDGDGYIDSSSDGTCSTYNCIPTGSSSTPGNDCNDTNPAIKPGATETCDGVDNDCDGSTDEGGVCPTLTYYSDNDGDGYIDSNSDGTCSTYNCIPTGSSSTPGNDCNDTNAAIHPGAIEVCDGVDNDCDGNVDEGIPSTPTTCGNGTCYRTGTYSCVNGFMVDSCVPGTPGTEKCDAAKNDEDCDGSNNEDCACNEGQTQNCGPETDAGECVFGTQTCDINGLWGDCIGAVYPTTEVCNGVDDNCNGAVDEGYVPTPTTCGVGACIASGELICSNGNETNTCIPGEPTSDANCNGVDDDCDGIVDDNYVETSTTCGVDLCVNNTGKVICVGGTTQEACTPLPPITVYFDNDNDLFGNAANTQEVCTIPDGYILTDDDCNDADATISPGADDICDANHNVIDKDCNAMNNGELDCNDFCGDIDGDGYVTAEKYGEWGGVIPSIICPWIIDNGDCNDADAAVYPGVADAVCNGVDDNCNGAVDEGYVPTSTSCGIGACARTGQLVCISGTVNNTCIPGTPAPETCNGIDDNCNGVADDLDADSDGLNDCSGADKCLGSVADNIALNPNQYAQNNFATSAFESGPSNDQSIVYNMQNTNGCTCKQIVAALGIGIGQIKKGCAPGIMQKWTGIDQNPDRVAGIGKK